MKTYCVFNRDLSITYRMFFLVVVNVMFLLNVIADDKQCPKCHGSGWQLTIPDVGHYFTITLVICYSQNFFIL